MHSPPIHHQSWQTILFGTAQTSAIHAAWWQVGAAILSLCAVVILGINQYVLVKTQTEFIKNQEKRESERTEKIHRTIRRLIADHLKMITTAVEAGLKDDDWFPIRVANFEYPVSVSEAIEHLEENVVSTMTLVVGRMRQWQDVIRILNDDPILDEEDREQLTNDIKMLKNIVQMINP